VDGDFDYVQFWGNIVDFFEKAPGRAARRSTERLLAWWTRYRVFFFLKASIDFYLLEKCSEQVIALNLVRRPRLICP
ncbi:hypothetical protein P692DRAFT_20762115, partial [Suillus brevipes Sb2]